MEEKDLRIPEYDVAPLEKREERIRSIEDKIRHGVHFIFLTDYHAKYNSCTSPALVRHLLAHTGLTHCFFGGDAINHEKTAAGMLAAQRDFVNRFGAMGADFYTVIGNHEYYVWENTPTEDGKPTTGQVFGAMCSHFAAQMTARGPLGSYVLCRPAEKVCYLTVPCDFDCLISDGLVAFLAEECLNIPAGYSCIAVGHAFVNNDAVPSFVRGDHLPICAMLDALNAGGVFEFGGKRYDYSGARQRTVVGIFSGHTHDDEFFSTEGGLPLIVTTSDAGRLETVLERTVGTPLEQAFDAVDIDFDRRIIHLTRIGAGEDREYTY